MSQYDYLVAAFPKTVFTVFDTETTGLDPKSNRVVEIGAIRFDARGIHSRFSVLINPNRPMPLEVIKINGITDEMLKEQPAAKQVLPDFMRFIGNSILIAHNAPFDISFINEELQRLGLPSLENKVLDTRIFAKEMFPGLPKYALQELAVRFGIQALDAHRAEDDARVCMELFLVCMQKLKENNPHLVAETVSSTESSAITASIRTPESYTEDLFNDELDIEEEFFDENPE